MTVAGVAAVEADPPVPVLLELLKAAGLPTSDIGAARAQYFFGVRGAGESWLAVVGIEHYGDDALLRSLVVMPEARARGLGAQLVAVMESWARQHGCRRVALLTTGAQAYFARLGYRVADRAEVSDALRASSQMASVCPASAALMVKPLNLG